MRPSSAPTNVSGRPHPCTPTRRCTRRPTTNPRLTGTGKLRPGPGPPPQHRRPGVGAPFTCLWGAEQMHVAGLGKREGRGRRKEVFHQPETEPSSSPARFRTAPLQSGQKALPTLDATCRGLSRHPGRLCGTGPPDINTLPVSLSERPSIKCQQRILQKYQIPNSWLFNALFLLLMGNPSKKT